jgi:hypothetical protein
LEVARAAPITVSFNVFQAGTLSCINATSQEVISAAFGKGAERRELVDLIKVKPNKVLNRQKLKSYRNLIDSDW